MQCPKCQHVNPPGFKFCTDCGALLGTAQRQPQPQPQTQATAGHTQLQPHEKLTVVDERKRVTVVFCVIDGSTALAGRLGEGRMHSLLNEFFSVAIEPIHRLEGHVNQFLGDGFMALFGAPIAHEDHPRRAALAAIAVRDAVSAHAWTHLPPGEALQIRIGLNMGAVIFGAIGSNQRAEVTAVGDTTNVAARLQGEAPPGGIACSKAMADTLAHQFECKPLGMRLLKGKDAPAMVYELVRRKADQPDTPEPSLPFEGRHDELSQCCQAIDTVSASHSAKPGALLTLLGDAGMGKSRLLIEARQYARQNGVRWIEGVSLSFGSTLSYWPFREVIRRILNINEDTLEAQAWHSLHTHMTDLFGQERGEDLAPFIAVLLSLTPPPPHQQRIQGVDTLSLGHQIFRAAYGLFERLAQQSPLIICFEDWHWADDSSAQLLAHLLPLCTTMPLLFVVASRPEQSGATAQLLKAIDSSEQVQSRHTLIRLTPLTREAAERLITSLLEGGTLAPRVQSLLIARALGNPFYLSELVHTLQATRAITRDAQRGEWIATQAFDALPLPDTIEGVILARIDRLDSDAKQLLKVASVVGRNFLHRVLQVITETDNALELNLTRLLQAQFIDQHQQAPELEYIFRHPLIHQTSYNSMIEERRRQLHQRIGQTIEEFFGHKIEEYYSVLAYHYAQAEHWPKAQEYLLKAADHAGAMSANQEALTLYRSAIAAAERNPSFAFTALQRAELDYKIGNALFRSGEVEQAIRQLHQALRRLGIVIPLEAKLIQRQTVWRLLKILPGLQLTGWRLKRSTQSVLDPVETLKTRILDDLANLDYLVNYRRAFLDMLMGYSIARRALHSPAHAQLLGGVGIALSNLGLRKLAGLSQAWARQVARQSHDTLAMAKCCQYSAIHHENVGKQDKAKAYFLEAQQLFYQIGHLRMWNLVCRQLGWILWASGQSASEGAALNQRMAATMENSPDPNGLAPIWFNQGRLHLHYLNLDAAIQEFDRVNLIHQAASDHLSGASAVAMLGYCHAQLGHWDEAYRCAQESWRVARTIDIRGAVSTPILMFAAQTLLMVTEVRSGEPREACLKQATQACAAASLQGKRTRNYGAAECLRLQGWLCWLTGKQEDAVLHWNAALVEAKARNAVIVLADTHHLMGQRLGERRHLEQAQALWQTMDSPARVKALALEIERLPRLSPPPLR